MLLSTSVSVAAKSRTPWSLFPAMTLDSTAPSGVPLNTTPAASFPTGDVPFAARPIQLPVTLFPVAPSLNTPTPENPPPVPLPEMTFRWAGPPPMSVSSALSHTSTP